MVAASTVQDDSFTDLFRYGKNCPDVQDAVAVGYASK
jgi:hypothetical protein